MAIHSQGDPLEAAPASSASKGTLSTEPRRFRQAMPRRRAITTHPAALAVRPWRLQLPASGSSRRARLSDPGRDLLSEPQRDFTGGEVVQGCVITALRRWRMVNIRDSAEFATTSHFGCRLSRMIFNSTLSIETRTETYACPVVSASTITSWTRLESLLAILGTNRFSSFAFY